MTDETEEETTEEVEDHGMNFDKRYTVGVLKPEQSSPPGSMCYGLFFETDKLAEAKKEADQAFKEDGLETVVWDREKWSSPDGEVVYRLSPEPEVKDDDDEPEQPKRKKRAPAKGTTRKRRSTKKSKPS